MKKFSSFFIILLTIGLSGCSGIQVSQDYDSSFNLTRLRTYAWETRPTGESGDVRLDNPLLHKRFHQSIDRTLQNRGYVLGQYPDFKVRYNFSIRREIDSDPYNARFGFGYGSYHRYSSIGFNAYPDIRQYDVGTLVIDFYSADSTALLWRGRGSKILGYHSDPVQTTKMVNELVEAILAQFPPGLKP